MYLSITATDFQAMDDHFSRVPLYNILNAVHYKKKKKKNYIQ